MDNLSTLSNVFYVFDFDDTIARSNATVKITSRSSGYTKELSSAEFANHVFDDIKNLYDFSSFDNIENVKCIHQTMGILHAVYASSGPSSIVILTSRESPQIPEQFLEKHDLRDVKVHAIGQSASKAIWIKNVILEKNLSHVVFYENSSKHIKDVINMRQTLRGIVKIDVWRVKELKQRKTAR